jgi:hypothetical protein
MKNKNNNQVTLMAIACVSVIAVTAMVLSAMMNVVSAQYTSYTTTVTQVGNRYYVNTSSSTSSANREAGWEMRRNQINREVAKARRKANRTGDSVLCSGVWVQPTPDTTLQVSRSLEERFQLDVKLDTRKDALNILYGAVLAFCAYQANNNGNDADYIQVAKVTLGTALITNIVSRGRRRHNAKL